LCKYFGCDKVCHWLAIGRWFSLGTTVSSTNKTDCHDITEILMLNTITLTPLIYILIRSEDLYVYIYSYILYYRYLYKSLIKNSWTCLQTMNKYYWYLYNCCVEMLFNKLVTYVNFVNYIRGCSISTYSISAHHHWRCEFESHSDEVYSIQHYVIKFVIDLQ
jgi:hypothetical protein